MDLDKVYLPPDSTAHYIDHDKKGPYVLSLGTAVAVLCLLLQAYDKRKYDERTNFIISNLFEHPMPFKYMSLQNLFQQGLDSDPTS